MSSVRSADVTSLLQAWGRGDAGAGDELMAAIHGDLRRLAAARLRGEGPRPTLTPTALVNEVYLRLVGQERVSWQNRNHFFAIAARMMRRVLVDHVRERRAAKRGGSWCRVTLDEALAAGEPGDVDLLDLDQALEELAERDPQKVQIVELRFFGGLSLEEAAQALRVSEATVSRHWRLARAWLFRRLGGSRRRR